MQVQPLAVFCKMVSVEQDNEQVEGYVLDDEVNCGHTEYGAMRWRCLVFN